MENCRSCNETDSCGQCENGYQLFNAAGFRVCIRCSIHNCKTCGLSNSQVVCVECNQGYSSNGGRCNQCLYPCASCTSNQAPNNCQTCQKPSFFSTPLANQACVKNSIPNCVDYNKDNVSLCEECGSGFKLNTEKTSCEFNCPKNCKICSDLTTCT